ncbi:MAG: hypothetical protein NBV60_10075 [Erythrobacter sp.]|nr:hypothetical protein [Erythrobacter sp.]
MTILRAAAVYWAAVFALGFVLGTIRVTWLIPLVGLTPATLIELPLILTGSWLAAGWVLRRFRIARPLDALAVGGLAFAMLMAAECALASVLTGQSPAQWLAGLRQPHALLGLAGQVVFALMPWWRARG